MVLRESHLYSAVKTNKFSGWRTDSRGRPCACSLFLTRTQKPTDSQLNTAPIPEVTSPWRDGLSWFHGQLPVPFLFLCSGIKDCISWESPLLPAVSTHHMASACADHRGLWLVPYLSAPHGTDNVSLKLKPQSVSMRVHAKKAIHKLLDKGMNFKKKCNTKVHRIHRTLSDAALCFLNVYVLKIKKKMKSSNLLSAFCFCFFKYVKCI